MGRQRDGAAGRAQLSGRIAAVAWAARRAVVPGRPAPSTGQQLHTLDGATLDALLGLVEVQAGLAPQLGEGGWDISWWIGVVLFEGWEHWWDAAEVAAPQTSRRLRAFLQPAWGYQLASEDLVHGDLNLPVREWQQQSRGVGEHLVARLLGHIGHPTYATPSHWEGLGPDRRLVQDPAFLRSVSQLWAYCGHGEPRHVRRRGMNSKEVQAGGKPIAKSVVHLIAVSCIKQVANNGRPAGQYREVYDSARSRYRDRIHQAPCVRCGPQGHPAKVGSPWSLQHQHMAALRLVGKEVLRDMWLAAKEPVVKIVCDECNAILPGPTQERNGAHAASCSRYRSRSDHRLARPSAWRGRQRRPST
jgi:hypothetical protein